MKIIISPAKKMQLDLVSFPAMSQPKFLAEARTITSFLKSRSQTELANIWQASPKIVEQASAQLSNLDLEAAQTPAIMAYVGIQYQYLAADVLSQAELDYLQAHLRILSGLYGSLRPFDAISPYRLEMQSKLPGFEAENLYDFWQDKIAQELYTDNDLVINLASSEYSRVIKPFLQPGQRLIDITFQERHAGKWKTAATHAKMSRGEMVRYLATHKIENAEDIKHFHDFGYQFCADESSANKFVFRTEFDFKRK